MNILFSPSFNGDFDIRDDIVGYTIYMGDILLYENSSKTNLLCQLQPCITKYLRKYQTDNQIIPPLIASRHFGPKVNNFNSQMTENSDSYIIHILQPRSIGSNYYLDIKAKRTGNSYCGTRQIHDSEHKKLQDVGRKLAIFLKGKVF